jgi:hypothetical protein
VAGLGGGRRAAGGSGPSAGCGTDHGCKRPRRQPVSLGAAAARGAGPAARRRDVKVAAAVVGARSVAAKCELRRARAGGGVKSGSGGGEGQGSGGGPS